MLIGADPVKYPAKLVILPLNMCALLNKHDLAAAEADRSPLRQDCVYCIVAIKVEVSHRQSCMGDMRIVIQQCMVVRAEEALVYMGFGNACPGRGSLSVHGAYTNTYNSWILTLASDDTVTKRSCSRLN